jgi:Mrp family chromosome partitioning ATPase/uncharacterized protein involved in exopolysaccharide biosynthesis
MKKEMSPPHNAPNTLAENFLDNRMEEFSMRDLISKIFLRPKTFLFAMLVPAIISVSLASLVPVEWTASTKILIRYSNTDSGILKDLVADSRTSLSGSTSAELIKSIPVLEKTIQEVGINKEDIYKKPMDIITDKISGFISAILGKKEKTAPADEKGGISINLVNAFKNSLDSSSKKSSSSNSIEILEKNSQSGDVNKIDELISLQVKSFNREKVAPMANGLAKAFIDDFYRMYAEEARRQSEYLSDLVRKEEAELRMLENATPQDFESGRINSSGGRELIARDIPIIVSMATELNQTENELTRVSQIYSADSPQVLRLSRQAAKLKFLLKKQERIEISKQLLEQLKARQYQAINTENIYQNRLIPINVVEMATEPPPSSTKKIVRLTMTAVVGLVLGLMLAISLMIVLNILDPRVHFRREVEQLTNIPILNVIPKVLVDVGEFKLKHFRLLKDHTEIKDKFFQIISKVGHKAEGSLGKVINVTSSATGDGATFCALALATSMAKNKSIKVCLIDANFYNPMITKLFGVNARHGLIEGLLEGHPLSKFQNNIQFNFSVIGAGSIGSRNQLGYYANGAKSQIAELKSLFDYIVIDGGSVLRGNEALVFGSFADETLLVASSGITRKGMLQAAVSKLQSGGTKITGVIFNQVREVLPSFIYKMF